MKNLINLIDYWTYCYTVNLVLEPWLKDQNDLKKLIYLTLVLKISIVFKKSCKFIAHTQWKSYKFEKHPKMCTVNNIFLFFLKTSF